MKHRRQNVRAFLLQRCYMSLELGPCLLEDVVEATVVDKGQEGETPTIEGGAMYFDVPLVGKRRTRRVLVAVNGVLSLGSRARLLLVRAKEAGSSVASSYR